ncbi:MAG: PIN domain-containing protein [Nitrospirales bacterium]|nr:PIN domain-containing protein [Nitrospirales bacterium]
MKILFDTNVVLDVLMDREPFSDTASELFSRVEDGSIRGYLCGTTITTVYYIAAKTIGSAEAREGLRKLLTLFEVAPITRAVVESALTADFNDFEDAVLHEAACHAGADAIVTRNQKDFGKSRIPVHTPTELLSILFT